MNLRELLAAQGDVIMVTENVNGRNYTKRRLTGESKDRMIKMVTDWFTTKGWKNKPSKSKSKSKSGAFIARKGKHHTKISWGIIDNWGPSWAARLEAKTPNGGWTGVIWSGADLDVMVEKAMTVPAPNLIGKDTLPDPITVGGRSSLVAFPVERTIKALNSWVSVSAVGVVGLEKNGTLSPKAAFKPGETPWFHCLVSAHDGSSAHIITDGEILHPVKSRGKFRVTSNVPCLVTNTTDFDKKLLTMAITTLFETHE